MAKKKRSNGPPKVAIGLARSSTTGQGIDGLGIRRQTKMIRDKADELGLELLDIYKEIESGTKSDRPQLARALNELAKQDPPGVLIGAELARLTRNFMVMQYITHMAQSTGVKIIACDIPELQDPNQTQFLWRMMAALAELQVKEIQKTTRERLSVTKQQLDEKGYWDTKEKPNKPSRRIKKLGNPNIKNVSKLGGSGMQEKAKTFAIQTYPIIQKLQKKGFTSLRAIARELNNPDGLHNQGEAVLTFQAWKNRNALRWTDPKDQPKWRAEQVKRVLANGKK